MPFIETQEQNPLLLQSPLGQDIAPDKKAPAIGATFGAAFDRENVIVNLARALTRDENPIDLNYRPYDDERVRGTPMETDERLETLYSKEDLDRYISDKAREDRSAEILGASGMAGIGASIVAGVMDPTIFLPGGALVKAKKGYSAAMIGTAASAQVAIQEGVLQATQETRTGDESLFAISSAALLAGILGAGASRVLSKGEAQVLAKALDKERVAMGGLTGGNLSSAAADAERTGLLKPFLPARVGEGFALAKDLIAKVPVVGKPLRFIAEIPEKLALKSNPMLRMATSEISQSRKALGDLASMPLETIDNARGITTASKGIPLDLDVKLTVNKAEVEMYETVNKSYSDYRFGRNVMMPAARDHVEKKFGKSEMLSHDDFMAEVDTALRNGDRHEVPQVAATAKVFRKWFDVVKAMAKEMKIDIGDDVLGAESFAPRVYDRIKLQAERPEFIKRYVAYRNGEQAKKAGQKAEIESQWTSLTKARADARRIEARLSTADQRIGDLESRLSERHSEAASAVKRSMTVADRDREARFAIEEANQFLKELREVSATDEIKKQISDLQDGISELERGMKPATQADIEAVDDIERKGILTGDMRRVARVLARKAKMPEPPSFWKWLRSQGGVKDLGGDLNNKGFRLQLASGYEWDDLQIMLAENFPELKARGWMGTADKPIDDFSDEIREALEDSASGREPEWFLSEKWDASDRFVHEIANELDEIRTRQGIAIGSVDDVADLLRGESHGITEADYDKMIADLEAGSASTGNRLEVEGLKGLVETRKGTLELFKDMLKTARNNVGKARGGGKVAGAARQEAGVAANRNLGRLRILHERAARADGIRTALERARDIASKQEAEALASLETRLGEWEGKSTGGVKSALVRRSELDAARSPEAKAKKPRLQSADKEIARAVRKILGSVQDKTDDELVSEAEQTINQIVSTPDGRLPKDEPGVVRQSFDKNDIGDVRGSLNERKLPMADNDLLPFLVRNPLDYAMRYLRQSMADLGMISRFGDTQGTVALKQMQDEAADLMRVAPTPERRLSIQKQLDSDIQDFAGMRDRIMGTYGFSADAFLQKAGRVAESVKSFSVWTMMGGSGLAQFPDFSGVVFRHGFQSAFKDGFAPFLANLSRLGGEKIKAAKAEYRALGIGAETFQSTRMLDAMDVSDVYHHRTPFERVLRGGATATMVLAGTTIMTDAQKVISASVAGNNILAATRAISEGRATPKQITALAAANIDAPRAEAIWKQFSEGGGSTIDGTYMPNLADWKDPTSQRFFEAAVLRDVEIAVITPGQEKPFFLSSPVLSMLGQFKTFVAAANTRILLANLQRRDATTLSGLIASIGLGMTAYAAYSLATGRPMHDRPQDWIKEGIDRSGVLGWFAEANNMSSKATGGKADLFRLIGADKPLSRYASRGLIGNVLGPSFGLAEDTTGLAYAASQGDWTESDVHKLRRLLPFQNLFYIRRLIDEVERNSNQFFGIETKAANVR